MKKENQEYIKMSFEKTKEATNLQLELVKIRLHLAKVKEENRSKSQKLGKLRNEASYYAMMAYKPAREVQEYKEQFLTNKDKVKKE